MGQWHENLPINTQTINTQRYQTVKISRGEWGEHLQGNWGNICPVHKPLDTLKVILIV